MSTLFAFLLGAAGPLATRVLVSLGIGVLAFSGVTEAMAYFRDYVVSAWSGIPADLAGLANLTGAPVAIGMVLAAATSRTAIWVGNSIARFGVVS